MYGGKVLGAHTGDPVRGVFTASGLAQWHDPRWNPLVAWAKSQGINPATMSGQLKMAAHEYITGWRDKLRPAIEAATSPRDITAATDPFEGYGGWQTIGPRGSAISGTAQALKAADAVKAASGTTHGGLRITDPSGLSTYPAPGEHDYTRSRSYSSGAIAPRPRAMNLSNWQAPDKGPSVAVHNKTGSDVFINASTLATA
jgi:hypothetical protein